MMRHLITITIIALVSFFMTTSILYAQNDEFAGGDGSPENPWQISEPEHLHNIRFHLDDHFELIDHINLQGSEFSEGEGWEPIGSCGYNVAELCTEPGFTGLLDGNTYTISGLHIDRETADVGLFGSLQDGAVVVDLDMQNVNITAGSEGNNYAGALAAVVLNSDVFAVSVVGVIDGYSHTGGVIGQLSNGFVQDVTADVIVTGQDNTGGIIGIINDGGNPFDAMVNRSSSSGEVTGRLNAGGLVGAAMLGAEIQLSYSTADVVANSHQAGGLVGGLMDASIDRSYATGEVTSWENSGGGLAGWNSMGTITDSYATGETRADNVAGGLVGSNSGGDIYRSYSTGVVGYVGEEGNAIGGLVGSTAQGGSVNDSFWNTETSEKQESDGGTGITTSEMHDKSTFTAAEWDFEDERIWDIEDPDDGAHSFPYLRDNEQDPPPGYEEIVSAGGDPDVPQTVSLDQNYPNPFNPTTRISFTLPEASDVRLTVYNMLGQQVGELVNDHLSAGEHAVQFDATGLASGMYIYRINAAGQQLSRQMIFVK